MSLWHIAWGYLWNRKFTTLLTIFSLALSVGLITTVMVLRDETRRRFEQEGQFFDIVIGAKESTPIQLVLNSAYFMNNPIEGNIDYSIYEQVKNEKEYVEAAYPIALGDVMRYGGFRVVGTTPDLFTLSWEGKADPFVLVDGRHFKDGFEAVLGADVAEETGYQVGDTFTTAHGLAALPEGAEHGHKVVPYKVVGVLERSGTPFDRAAFVPLTSIWEIHAHEEEEEADAAAVHDEHEPLELTSILVRLYSPAARFEFKEYFNKTYNAMAVVPIMEVQKLYEQLLGTAKAVLMWIGYLVVVISAMTILIGLYLSIVQRRRDFAIMRALGATKGEIFGAILIEAFWVSLFGILVGYVLSTGVTWWLGGYLAREVGLRISAFTLSQDLFRELSAAYSVVLIMGLLAGLLPAWQAYRTDVARNLAEL